MKAMLLFGLVLLTAGGFLGCRTPGASQLEAQRLQWFPERPGRLIAPPPEKLPFLRVGERVLLYCDESSQSGGREAVVLTTERLVYRQAGSDRSISLEQVLSVTRQQRTFSEVFVVRSRTGEEIRVELAGHADANTFQQVLARQLGVKVKVIELPSVASE